MMEERGKVACDGVHLDAFPFIRCGLSPPLALSACSLLLCTFLAICMCVCVYVYWIVLYKANAR